MKTMGVIQFGVQACQSYQFSQCPPEILCSDWSSIAKDEKLHISAIIRSDFQILHNDSTWTISDFIIWPTYFFGINQFDYPPGIYWTVHDSLKSLGQTALDLFLGLHEHPYTL